MGFDQGPSYSQLESSGPFTAIHNKAAVSQNTQISLTIGKHMANLFKLKTKRHDIKNMHSTESNDKR